MIHILLTILKILGIVLLVILGLVLFVLLSVLFVPIRYRLTGKKNDETMEAAGIVTWLFGMIRVTFQYKEKKTSLIIRIFGISVDAIKQMVQKIKKLFKKKKKTVKPKKESSVEKSTPKEPIKKSTSSEVPIKETSVKEIPLKEISDKESKEEVPKESKLKKIWEKILEILKKVFGIPAKVLAVIKKIKLTITDICDKIKYWKNFINEETTKEAIRCVKSLSWRLIRHILPRKIKGFVRFGLDDPATTGQILGGLSMITPLYKSKFRVIPVFEEKAFECDIQMKGRLYGVVIVKILIDGYRNRALKTTIKKFQHKEA